MSKKTWIWFVAVIGLMVALVVLVNKAPDRPGELDAFASCLAEKGAKFYGAFWCPHCKNQKAMFGSSAKHLPYVECSAPDGNSQLQICKDAGVQGYPTWEFGDGSRESGEVSLDRLSEKTNCPLPDQFETTGGLESPTEETENNVSTTTETGDNGTEAGQAEKLFSPVQ